MLSNLPKVTQVVKWQSGDLTVGNLALERLFSATLWCCLSLGKNMSVQVPGSA